MIDKTTFIICLLKLLGLQIILIGVFFGILHNAPLFEVMVCIGCLVFAIGSNVLLAINVRAYRKLKNGGDHNGKFKSEHNRQNLVRSN